MSSAIPRTASFTSSIDEKALTPSETLELPAFPIKHSWFRGTFFQATVVGACAFLSPGIWGSMNSTGAGGAQSPYLVNAANSLVFGLMIVTCLFASSITNRLGYKWALVLGTVGYAPYAAGLYENKLHGTVWLVLFGSVCCGLSAGLFWGVEGAIIMGYPEEKKRGRYLAYWLSWRNAGQLLGGIINLALNAKSNTVGSVSSNTYLVFIALQAIAPLFALLLSTPDKVVRDNGTKVHMKNNASFKTEMCEMWGLMKRREVLLMVPISFFAQYSASYTGTFLSLYFSVRARALASFCVAIAGVGANVLLGVFLDDTRITKNFRSKASFIFIMALMGGVWVWFTVLQVRFTANPPKLDWVDGAAFAGAWTAYLLFYMAYYLIQNELYWQISQLARNPQEMVRLSSFLRGLESAGTAAVAFGVSSKKSLNKAVPLSFNFGLWGISTVTAWFTIKEVGASIDYQYEPEQERERDVAVVQT